MTGRLHVGKPPGGQQGARLQEFEIRVEISGRAARSLTGRTGHGPGIKLPYAHRQRASELVGNFILDTEDILQAAIKMCGPNQGTACRIHELHRDPQAIRLALHAAADQVAGMQAPTDLARVHVFGGKRERGIA